MAQQFSAEWAKSMIDEGMQKAQGLVDDPEQVNELLAQLQEKLQGLPATVSSAFANVPLMASMVKSYITREYTEVSPKVVISLVSAFIYFVKKKDIIPDDIPIVGYADDLAVATIAMAINEPELRAYAAWRERQSGNPVEAISAETIGSAQLEADGLAQAEPINAAEAAARNAVDEALSQAETENS